MNLSYGEFELNLADLRKKIDDACAAAGRPTTDVKLLSVTKTHPAEAAEWAWKAGLEAAGENRVQEALDKMQHCQAPIRWELIGQLQSNKAKAAAQHFHRVQSVDRIKLVNALNRHAGEAERVLPVLLQVNAGEDPNKAGADVPDAPTLLEAALQAENLKVDGLMTIAPLDDDPDSARRCFERLREIRDDLAAQFGCALPELSMGMSGDFVEAIAAGSTIIRVGSALFGAR